MRKLIKTLYSREDGATLVEFAFVVPIFLTLLFGVFDLVHSGYTRSTLEGTMQKAGRDFTLENAASSQTSVEKFVTDQVQGIAPSATVTFTRRAYFDFADVGQPEDFDDLNGDQICNNNEPFEDDNDNGQWDSDKGEDSFGGARDAVLLTANVQYARLFPMAGLIGMDPTVELEAATVLRNQPFDTQDISVEVRNCP